MRDAKAWLDKKPSAFVSTMKKSISSPALANLSPDLGMGPGVSPPRTTPKSFTRRTQLDTGKIVAAEAQEEQGKRRKELRDAETRADAMRREHSHLVAARLKAAAKCQQLKGELAHVNAAVATRDEEQAVLEARVTNLRREAEQLEAEVTLEELTTPRYEMMLRRTRANKIKAEDRSAAPSRELQRINGRMERNGDNHLSAQFDAMSLEQGMVRYEDELRSRAVEQEREREKLRQELAEGAQNKGVIADMM